MKYKHLTNNQLIAAAKPICDPLTRELCNRLQLLDNHLKDVDKLTDEALSLLNRGKE